MSYYPDPDSDSDSSSDSSESSNDSWWPPTPVYPERPRPWIFEDDDSDVEGIEPVYPDSPLGSPDRGRYN
ncbi:hypothetical protein MMC25_005765 [Agyrium rufum]|nr:hypothetical protein [Agyrium rufum]